MEKYIRKLLISSPSSQPILIPISPYQHNAHIFHSDQAYKWKGIDPCNKAMN